MKRKSYNLEDFQKIIDNHGNRIDEWIIKGMVCKNKRRIAKEHIVKEIGIIKGFLLHYYDISFTFEWAPGGLPGRLIINEKTDQDSFREIHRYNFLKSLWRT